MQRCKSFCVQQRRELLESRVKVGCFSKDNPFSMQVLAV